jgi:MoaA/NifB/PqqE/SkfB family radical SAM enzyme
LSHLPDNDVPLETILHFISSFSNNIVRRVFIAGGEPLQWRHVFRVIDALKAKGAEVVICTNGLPMLDAKVIHGLLESNVNAVSISLDSFDAQYNDTYRRDPRGIGFNGVVRAIKALVAERNARENTCRIGVYTVLTRINLAHLQRTAEFVSQLGVDYYVFQPISLPMTHALYAKLAIGAGHGGLIAEAIQALQNAALPLLLPNTQYLQLLLCAADCGSSTVYSCFGGRDLFFIQPDGTVWDCPSCYKIAADASINSASVKSHSAAELFGAHRRGRNTNCNHFSVDCVNMWQLMAFDGLLHRYV